MDMHLPQASIPANACLPSREASPPQPIDRDCPYSIMKKPLVGLFACLLLASVTIGSAAAKSTPAVAPAQLTLTVTTFRSSASLSERIFVDAATSLAPHPAVTLVDREGLPTLVVGQALDVEVSVDSADPSESYRPIGILFEQQADASGAKTDPAGAANFTQWPTNQGRIVIRNKYVHTGAHGQYEFFVVIQRVSDGAIGIIDPGMDNHPQN